MLHPRLKCPILAYTNPFSLKTNELTQSRFLATNFSGVHRQNLDQNSIKEIVFPSGQLSEPNKSYRPILRTCKPNFKANQKNVIFHLYNSTSTLQREVVFKKDKVGITKIATEGAELVQKLSEEYKLDKEKVCYAGDSEKDKALLSYVKFSYVPADVDEVVRNSAKTVLKNSRGQGIIKELAEKVLRISNKLNGKK